MRTKLWVALLALYIVWGSTYLGIKVAIETIPPFFHAAVRFLASGIILVIWQRSAGVAMPTRQQWISTAIIGNLLLLGGNGLVSWAEQFIPSGIAALIIGSVPIFLVIGEALRPGGVKPNWQAILGIIIGFIGIYVLVGPTREAGMALNVFGVIALLSACVLWTFGSIYSKNADLPKSVLMSTGAQMLMGSIGLFIVSALTGELVGWDVSAVSARSIYGVLYLIFIGSLIGFVAYGWLLQNAPISLVATYAYVNPLVAVLLGSLLAGEPVGAQFVFSAALIIGAVALITMVRWVQANSRLRAAQKRP